MKLSKNDIIERLEITDVTAEGNGVGHIAAPDGSGAAVFVSGAVTGDVIRCKIVKEQKSYYYGIILELLTPSPDRADRGCNVKNTCGGCVFRHISYSAELKIKENIVKNAFVRLGKFPEDSFEYEPIEGCTETDGYRNKAQYPVAADRDGKTVCGFYANRSHRVIPCTDCKLQPDIFSDILRFTMEYVNRKHISPYNEKTGTGLLRHIYIRRGYHSGEIAVCFVVRKNISRELCPLGTELMSRFPEIKSVMMNINPANTNVIMGDKLQCIAGEEYITDTMCGNKIILNPLSFYQVNTPQAERLYAIAADYAALTGTEDVLDLYCGAGTIGLSIADRAGHVTGAEIIPEAVVSAKQNAENNNIRNADFICADAGQAAKQLLDSGRKPDVIITDPPRKGCDELTLDSIVKMAPERIVMISCNPATAARDCRYLADKGYRLVRVRAVDMFPAAGHVECVCLMEKEQNLSKKI
ncbi:MAG: 23S rRNA (uracil(1939)-C(5))-methyltransferase RlmD [Oscillospiraceae bacterium]|nr:23S rRNA (uracil(1939)-C(5))-methyltransferase RlmD [Oscillospiraceae bacterium]